MKEKQEDLNNDNKWKIITIFLLIFFIYFFYLHFFFCLYSCLIFSMSNRFLNFSFSYMHFFSSPFSSSNFSILFFLIMPRCRLSSSAFIHEIFHDFYLYSWIFLIINLSNSFNCFTRSKAIMSYRRRGKLRMRRI